MRLRGTRLIALYIAVLIGVVSSASARTWRVSRDGLGDFQTLQPAADAAAPGDTLLIGPGRYVEYQSLQIDCCQSREVYLLIDKPDISIVGAHRDSVLVGPDEIAPLQMGVVTLMGSADGLYMEGLTLSNLGCAFRVTSRVSAVNVHFTSSGDGILAAQFGTGTIESCKFTGISGYGIAAASGSEELRVSECTFTDCDGGMNFTGSVDPTVLDCRLDRGFVGITASGAAVRLRIERSTLVDQTIVGLNARNHAELLALDNVVSTQFGTAVVLSTCSTVEMRRNVLVGGPEDCIYVSAQREPIMVKNNDIKRGGGYLVRLDNYFGPNDGILVDFTENYWNTTDVDSLNAWMYDKADDSNQRARVQFQPFLDAILPAAPRSIGSLKSSW